MRTATFEVRIRLSDEDGDEARAALQARYKLLDVKGALSAVQIGPVDDNSTLIEEARR